jgi:SAM-dependent methyltransferase
MTFLNSWGNATRADSYAKLEFPNTYFLAYRDLPEITIKHVSGNKALDFGCGTGRSTRFLEQQGFEVTGIDISTDMLDKARKFDSKGNYELVADGNYNHFEDNSFDLIQSIFTFDNIPGLKKRVDILYALSRKLKNSGKIIMLDSTPEIYFNEWASFSTSDFPENRLAKDGDIVKIIMTDVEDSRPVEDIIWSHDHYKELFRLCELEIEAVYKPLGKPDEEFEWIRELEVAPWVIYILKKL